MFTEIVRNTNVEHCLLYFITEYLNKISKVILRYSSNSIITWNNGNRFFILLSKDSSYYC